MSATLGGGTQKCTGCGNVAEFFEDDEPRKYYCEIFQIVDPFEEEDPDSQQTVN